MPPKRPKPKTASLTPYRVFVSHATADKGIAVMVCDKIDAIPGAATFRDDRDIEGGDAIPETLYAAVRRSNEVLVLLTPTSVIRQWVILEIGLALAYRKRIVPVWYNTTIDQVPALAPRKGFPLADLDKYLADLAARVRRVRA